MSNMEDHISILENLQLVDEDEGEYAYEALEAAKDSMSFVQSLWNMFVQLGEISPDSKFDLAVLEKSVERINNQLAAASMFIASFPDGVGEKMLRSSAQNLATQCKDHPDQKAVATVVESYGSLADKVSKLKPLLVFG